MSSALYFLSVVIGVGNKIVLIISTPFSMFFLFPYFHIFHHFHFLFRACGKGKLRTFQNLRNSLTLLKIYSKTEMCPRLVSVSLAISYHLDFPRISLKFGAYLNHASVRRVQSKECYFKCTLTFRRFLLLFVFRFFSFQFLLLGYCTLMQMLKSPVCSFLNKIVPWKFCVLDPKNFRVMHP